MLVVAITGSISTGKTSISKLISNLSSYHSSLFIADDVVATALLNPEVISQISKLDKSLLVGGNINKAQLSNLAFNDPNLLKILEGIFHPIVKKELLAFLNKSFYLNKKFVILDIPLLFKSGINEICDYKILVKSYKSLQKIRYLSRNNSSVEKLNKILAIANKKCLKENRFDFIINSNSNLMSNRKLLAPIINKIINNERSSFRYRNNRFKCREW
jgi:dephospho-CoA kinase